MPVLMWRCEVCGEESDYNHDACWSCNARRPPDVALPVEARQVVEETIGEHLRRTVDGVLIFYPRGFESQGYLVRDQILERKLMAQVKFDRTSKTLFALGVTLLCLIPTAYPEYEHRFLAMGIGLIVIYLGQMLAQVWWQRHLDSLAEGLMPLLDTLPGVDAAAAGQ